MTSQPLEPTMAIGTPSVVAAHFAQALGLDVGPDSATEVAGEDCGGTVAVAVPAARWHDALEFARVQLGLDFFDWLSAVDETDAEPPGLDVVVHLVQSMSGGAPAGESAGLVRVLVRTRVGDGVALHSATDLWPGAAWHERETYEMFGLAFDGFDDGTGLGLRPLLLPEGFEGTPLRKSFVLAARASKPWPGAKEPGESEASSSPSRRKLLPPGVPDPTWGPRTDRSAPPVASGPEAADDRAGDGDG